MLRRAAWQSRPPDQSRSAGPCMTLSRTPYGHSSIHIHGRCIASSSFSSGTSGRRRNLLGNRVSRYSWTGSRETARACRAARRAETGWSPDPSAADSADGRCRQGKRQPGARAVRDKRCDPARRWLHHDHSSRETTRTGLSGRPATNVTPA